MTYVEALNFIFETNDCCYCEYYSNCKNQCETAYSKIYDLCKKADEKEA